MSQSMLAPKKDDNKYCILNNLKTLEVWDESDDSWKVLIKATKDDNVVSGRVDQNGFQLRLKESGMFINEKGVPRNMVAQPKIIQCLYWKKSDIVGYHVTNASGLPVTNTLFPYIVIKFKDSGLLWAGVTVDRDIDVLIELNQQLELADIKNQALWIRLAHQTAFTSFYETTFIDLGLTRLPTSHRPPAGKPMQQRPIDFAELKTGDEGYIALMPSPLPVNPAASWDDSMLTSWEYWDSQKKRWIMPAELQSKDLRFTMRWNHVFLFVCAFQDMSFTKFPHGDPVGLRRMKEKRDQAMLTKTGILAWTQEDVVGYGLDEQCNGSKGTFDLSFAFKLTSAGILTAMGDESTTPKENSHRFMKNMQVLQDVFHHIKDELSASTDEKACIWLRFSTTRPILKSALFLKDETKYSYLGSSTNTLPTRKPYDKQPSRKHQTGSKSHNKAFKERNIVAERNRTTGLASDSDTGRSANRGCAEIVQADPEALPTLLRESKGNTLSRSDEKAGDDHEDRQTSYTQEPTLFVYDPDVTLMEKDEKHNFGANDMQCDVSQHLVGLEDLIFDDIKNAPQQALEFQLEPNMENINHLPGMECNVLNEIEGSIAKDVKTMNKALNAKIEAVEHGAVLESELVSAEHNNNSNERVSHTEDTNKVASIDTLTPHQAVTEHSLCVVKGETSPNETISDNPTTQLDTTRHSHTNDMLEEVKLNSMFASASRSIGNTNGSTKFEKGDTFSRLLNLVKAPSRSTSFTMSNTYNVMRVPSKNGDKEEVVIPNNVKLSNSDSDDMSMDLLSSSFGSSFTSAGHIKPLSPSEQNSFPELIFESTRASQGQDEERVNIHLADLQDLRFDTVILEEEATTDIGTLKTETETENKLSTPEKANACMELINTPKMASPTKYPDDNLIEFSPPRPKAHGNKAQNGIHDIPVLQPLRVGGSQVLPRLFQPEDVPLRRPDFSSASVDWNPALHAQHLRSNYYRHKEQMAKVALEMALLSEREAALRELTHLDVGVANSVLTEESED